MSHNLLAAIAAFSSLAFAQQEAPRMSAREIFYGAPPAAAQKRTEPTKKSPANTPSNTPSNTSVASTTKKAAPAILAESNPKPANSTTPNPTTPNDSPVTPARLASETTGGPAGLAMRWSIMQRLSNGDTREVPTTTAFKEGDKINVRVEVNDFGYLYILSRGSSGTWTPLFPSPKIAGGDNRVGPNQPYMIPSGYAFTFDNQPGAERLMVVFSRKPENDFDSLLYKVAPARESTTTPSTPAPAGTPAPKSTPKPTEPHPGIIMASNTTIGDPFIDRIRTTYARDLIVEKVEGQSASSVVGPKFEYAAYVASPRKDDPRVVAEVTLTHK